MDFKPQKAKLNKSIIENNKDQHISEVQHVSNEITQSEHFNLIYSQNIRTYKYVIALLIAVIAFFAQHFYSDTNSRLKEIRNWQEKNGICLESQKKDVQQLKIDNQKSLSELQRNIKINEDRLRDIERAYQKLNEVFKKVGAELITLAGTQKIGEICFYKEELPRGNPQECVCAISQAYPWDCSQRILNKYYNKTVLVSIDGYYDYSHEFKIKGFFTPTKTNQMVKIHKTCLKNIVGEEEAIELMKKETLIGKIIFPSEIEN